MTIEDLKKLKQNISLPFRVETIRKNKSHIAINNKIALPVNSISTSFMTDSDISIIDKEANEIGFLCFTAELGEIAAGMLTENQFIAFLTEAKYSDINSPYKFSTNYLVLKDTEIGRYKRQFMKTSALWGSFTHINDDHMLSTHKIFASKIEMISIDFPKAIFYENAMRAIAQPFAFERFLKLYHLLELIFDYQVIEKIKKLDIEKNPEGIALTLNEYSYKEFDRLKDVIHSSCKNITPIVTRLNSLSKFINIANDIFFKFGKEGNPLNRQYEKFEAIVNDGFEEKYLKKHKISYHDKYPEFILNLTCYWIYRTRCCIAHNKIGEYVLTMKEENFIVEFAEPLLREVLIQIFKK